jgi:hypothetical protein
MRRMDQLVVQGRGGESISFDQLVLALYRNVSDRVRGRSS